MSVLNGYEILSGDTVTAVFENGELKTINSALLPLFLKNTPDLESWLETRAIDSHRANSRMLKKALRLAEKDDISTVLHANGATITDNYWVRPCGSTVSYPEIRFDEKYFSRKSSKSLSKLALKGSPDSFAYISGRNVSQCSELTNTGSFEKCWKNIDGRWWMFKDASRNEIFSEVFIYRLCCNIGINCAVYEKDEKSVKTLDFTESKVNFEPALTFMGDDEDYENVIAKLNEICPAAVGDYIRLIFLDALVFNPDRHTANFGLIRDMTSGELTGLAPCFDHNMALISRGYPSSVRKDILISLFCDVINAHREYIKYIPSVNQELLKCAFDETGMKVREKAISDFILGRYGIICSECGI